MKTSSDPAEAKRIDKPTAWACLAANLFTVPGVGTVAAGRKIGYLQAALGLVGFGLSVLGFVGILRDWGETGGQPEGMTPSLWVGVAGICLWGASWLWALASSLRLHRQAREEAKKTP